MRSFLSLILIFIYSAQLKGQDLIRGKVVESMAKKGIAGVTISLRGKAIGYTDKNGFFTVALTGVDKKDSLTFSNLLYLQKKIAIEDMLNKPEVILVENIRQLEDVTIAKRKTKPKWLYNKGLFSNQFGSPAGSDTDKEIAKGFVAPKAGLWLKRIKIPKYTIQGVGIPYRSRFILHIYDVDVSTGGPGKELFSKELYLHQGNYNPIVYRQEKNRSYFDIPSSDEIIDLSKYFIIAPSKIFFIGIEKLFIPFNEVLTDHPISVAKLESQRRIFKEASHSTSVSYLPLIAANFLTKRTEIDTKFIMNWYKNEDQKWFEHHKRYGGYDGEKIAIDYESLIDVEIVD